MPTERVVEVVVGSYREGLNPKAAPSAPMHEKFTASAKVSPSSLTAAMLTLAEAVDRYWHRHSTASSPADWHEVERLGREHDAALAAVHNHPDYKRPE